MTDQSVALPQNTKVWCGVVVQFPKAHETAGVVMSQKNGGGLDLLSDTVRTRSQSLTVACFAIKQYQLLLWFSFFKLIVIPITSARSFTFRLEAVQSDSEELINR